VFHHDPRRGYRGVVTVIVVTIFGGASGHKAFGLCCARAAEPDGDQPGLVGGFELKPHLAETFKLPPDPEFIEKVPDIARLYLNPPGAAVVPCLNERSTSRPSIVRPRILALMPGVPQRRGPRWESAGDSLRIPLNPFAQSVLRPGLKA